MYSLVRTGIHAYYAYCFITGRDYFRNKEMLLHEIDPLYKIAINVSFHIFTQLILLVIIYLLWMIRQYLRHVRRVIQIIDEVGMRNVVWTSPTSMPAASTSETANFILERKKCLMKIQSLCTSINNTFSACTDFYKCFVCFQLIVSVFIGIHHILVLSNGLNLFYLVHLIICLLELEILLVLLCTAIRYESQAIHSLLNNYCYMSQLKPLKADVNKCVR